MTSALAVEPKVELICHQWRRSALWIMGLGSASSSGPVAPRRSPQESFGKPPRHVRPPHPARVRSPKRATCTLEQRLAAPLGHSRLALGYKPCSAALRVHFAASVSLAALLGRCSTCRRVLAARGHRRAQQETDMAEGPPRSFSLRKPLRSLLGVPRSRCLRGGR
jgi:hypothetical protein